MIPPPKYPVLATFAEYLRRDFPIAFYLGTLSSWIYSYVSINFRKGETNKKFNNGTVIKPQLTLVMII